MLLHQAVRYHHAVQGVSLEEIHVDLHANPDYLRLLCQHDMFLKLTRSRMQR